MTVVRDINLTGIAGQDHGGSHASGSGGTRLLQCVLIQDGPAGFCSESALLETVRRLEGQSMRLRRPGPIRLHRPVYWSLVIAAVRLV